MSRQCQCGGIIASHSLTESRESWKCKSCGRSEVVEVKPADLLAERDKLKAANAELAPWLSWALNMLPSEEQKTTWQYSQARAALAKYIKAMA